MSFVRASLAAGHEVRAGIHHHNPFELLPNLSTLTCDSTSLSDVRQLLQGQDVVVSLVGHVKGSNEDVQTKTIDTAISVMNELGIKRLVSLTGTGVRFQGDRIRLIDRFMNGSIGLIDPKRIQDGINHVDSIKRSNLDWTIIRVLKLQNIEAKPYILTTNGPTKVLVGRDEVSKAILEVISEGTFIRSAPMLSPSKL